MDIKDFVGLSYGQIHTTLKKYINGYEFSLNCLKFMYNGMVWNINFTGDICTSTSINKPSWKKNETIYLYFDIVS